MNLIDRKWSNSHSICSQHPIFTSTATIFMCICDFSLFYLKCKNVEFNRTISDWEKIRISHMTNQIRLPIGKCLIEQWRAQRWWHFYEYSVIHIRVCCLVSGKENPFLRFHSAEIRQNQFDVEFHIRVYTQVRLFFFLYSGNKQQRWQQRMVGRMSER